MNSNLKVPLILNQTNALILNSVDSYKNSILSTFWHKFIIHEGASLDSKQILKSIVQCGDDIFPIQYDIEGNNATFIARNCKKAIENLCARNLVLKYAEGKPPAIFSIHVNKGVPNETTINIQDVITRAIKKRYTEETGVLNLENFVDDPDLRNTVYCAINQQKVLMFVLSLANGLNVRCLRLNNNEMTNIDGLEVLAFCSFNRLHSVDLRNNLIANISDLNLLKKFKITELWLDENPICNAYKNYDYVLNIKNLCPNIKILDGEELFKNGIPISRRNYLINYSSLTLVDQFLEHYFKLYETSRESLIDLYHSDALFSLTTSLIPDQITSRTKRLDEFQKINRNLLTDNNSPKYEKWLYHSREDIVKMLCKLSASEHDLSSFTVDVIYHSDETTVISVTGVFREGNDNEHFDSSNLLNFSRTFVLLSTLDGEYHIMNDQLFISNATTSQVKFAFQNYDEIKLKTDTAEEQSCIIKTMVEICETNVDIAKRLLEITNWDLKSSLTIFVDQNIQQLKTSTNEPKSSNNNPSWKMPSTISNLPVRYTNPSIEMSYPPLRPPIDISNPSIEIAYPTLPPMQISNPPLEIAYPPPRPPIEILNPPLEAYPSPRPLMEISNPPIETQYPPFEIPYPSLETSNSLYGLPHPNNGISNLHLEFQNQFSLSTQSSQISSTTNECISGLSEGHMRKKQNTITINSDKSQYAYPRQPQNLVKNTTTNPIKIINQKENSVKESITNTSSITQMYTFVKILEVKDGVKKTLNQRPVQNTFGIKKKRNNRCRKCRIRHPQKIKCINTSNPVTTLTNINTDGEGKELKGASTKISSTEGDSNSEKASGGTETIKSTKIEKLSNCEVNTKQKSENNSGTLQTTSENKDNTKTDLNIKSNNRNAESTLKGSSETIESTKIEKFSNSEDTEKQKSGSVFKIHQTTFENDNTKTDLKTEMNVDNSGVLSQNKITLNLKSNNENSVKELQGSSETKIEDGIKQKSESSIEKNDINKISLETKTNSNTDQNLRPICWYCNKIRHDVFECQKRKKDIQNGVFDFEKFFNNLKTINDGKNITTTDVQKSSANDNTKTNPNAETNFDNSGALSQNQTDINLTCTSCKEGGHTKGSKKCKLHPNKAGELLAPVCWYCNTKRHLLDVCQKRKLDVRKRVFDYDKFLESLQKFEAENNFIISKDKQILVCDYCASKGHTQSLCNKLNAALTQIIKQNGISDPFHIDPDGVKECGYCGKLGHSIFCCNIIKTEIMVIATDNQHPKIIQKRFSKKLFCSECKQSGHVKSHCVIFETKLCNKLQDILKKKKLDVKTFK